MKRIAQKTKRKPQRPVDVAKIRFVLREAKAEVQRGYNRLPDSWYQHSPGLPLRAAMNRIDEALILLR